MTETKLTYKDKSVEFDAKDLETIHKFAGRAISYNVIRQAQAEIGAMLEEFAEDIDKAYIQADNDLTVPFTVQFKPTRIAGEIELIVGTNFVKDRVKHKIKVVVDSKQKKLPGFDK